MSDAVMLRQKITELELESKHLPEYRLLQLIEKWNDVGAVVVRDICLLTSARPEPVLAEVTTDPEITSAILSRI